MNRRILGTLGVLLAALLLFSPAHAQTLTPQQQVAAIHGHVDVARAAAQSGDVARAQAETEAFHTEWAKIEDGVRDTSPAAYTAIEDALHTAQAALATSPVDTAALTAALTTLDKANEAFMTGLASGATTSRTRVASLGSILPVLAEAQAALDAGNLAGARAEVDEFRMAWPDVEGAVATRDADAYERVEALMTAVSTQLAAGQAEPARASLVELQQRLQPFSAEAQRYSAFDAMSIVLREGLEAILIIAALLGFLQKSGNADKRRWIWAGGALGILASLIAAVAIQQLFSAVFSGANREVMEGITGLFAAAMLLYVSYWMHSQTHIRGWQRYVQEKTTAALATGSLFSLALLAFLAVFREGAETTLFYIGIAPSIAVRDLLIGLGAGVALLIVIGVAVIVLGKRLPLKPFFQVASVLVWYLAFKFIGLSIHQLQVGRVVPETPIAWLPTVDFLGIYPTWETLVPQLVLLLGALGVVLWTRRVAVRQMPAQAS